VGQQVLAYMNVPHDVELQDSHRLQLLAKASKEDVNEAAPDHIGEEVETSGTSDVVSAQTDSANVAKPVTAPVVATDVVSTPKAIAASLVSASAPAPASASGTVVLDVAGGVEVPDFRGKPLRTALEQAENAGIELEVSGSGVGIEQSPAAGSRIPPGGHVSVKFGR
jgi:hypothetical protein